RGDALVATALRTRSVSMRDILVHGALRTSMTSEDLTSLVLADKLDTSQIKDAHMLGNLGRLVVLLNLLDHDDVYGETLLYYAHQMHPGVHLSVESLRFFILHRVAMRYFGVELSLLDLSSDIDRVFFVYLRAELYNPFVVAESEKPVKCF